MKSEVRNQRSEATVGSPVPKIGFGSQVTWCLAIFVLSLTIVACSEEKEELDITADYTYFPLEIGKYWVYEVDSIVFLNLARRDTSKTWLKEQITSYFIDNVGDTIYRVDQFERKKNTLPWEIKRVVSLSRNNKKAIRTENNIPLIKMVFPLTINSKWNSTVLTNPFLKLDAPGGDLEIFKYWESKVEKIDAPFTDRNTNYAETTTIFHAQKDIGLENRYAKEIYAKHIGLIQREWQILDCNSTLSNCFTPIWDKKGIKGFTLVQRLVEYN